MKSVVTGYRSDESKCWIVRVWNVEVYRGDEHGATELMALLRAAELESEKRKEAA